MPPLGCQCNLYLIKIHNDDAATLSGPFRLNNDLTRKIHHNTECITDLYVRFQNMLMMEMSIISFTVCTIRKNK